MKAAAREEGWKRALRRDPAGFYRLPLPEGEVRVFMTPELLDEAEDSLGPQIANARRFPGVRDVVITPDAHHGYGVPVGCVMATSGTLAMGPVGYDIGCGIAALRSTVPRERATPDAVRAFSQRVMRRVGLGVGRRGQSVTPQRFQELVRGGAEALGVARGQVAERDRIPVEDAWDVPQHSRAWRGQHQLGSLGGGNHFIELQYAEEPSRRSPQWPEGRDSLPARAAGGLGAESPSRRSPQRPEGRDSLPARAADDHSCLWVMYHTGSRGFGHGLASWYFEAAREELGLARGQMDLGYFTPDSRHWRDYKNAVAAGGNFAIVNRLLIGREVAAAFAETFGEEPELVYEISHNLVQEEHHPDLFREPVFVHRKGATRALPAGHPMLAGTRWAHSGHPVLIPGSMGDPSYVLRPLPGAARALYSVNHGCGRRKSRTAARREIPQAEANRRMRELGVMVNAGGDVPVDESPACYKSAEAVIAAVVAAGLAEVQTRLHPVASIKGID